MNRQFTLLLALSIVCFVSVSCAPSRAIRKDQAEVSRRLGEAYLAEGNFTSALKALLKAEKLYEKDALLQNDLGLAYFAKEKFDLAIEHFERAVALKQDYSEALNNMGTLYLRLGQLDSAIESFNRAVDNLLYVTPHYALSNLGEAYRGKKDYDRSIGFYKKALKANPGFPTAHRGLGLTYMATGNHEAAISSLEKAVQYGPRFAFAYFDLGRAYAGQYDTEGAVSAFKKVVELAPDTPLADSALAEIRRLQEY